MPLYSVVVCNVPVQRRQQSVRTHYDRTFWQLIVILLDTLEVVARRVGLTNGTGGEVQNLVPISTYVRVELGYTEMRPVAPDHCEDMAQRI